MTRIAILCSGLGNVRRGHEVFVRGLVDLLAGDLDITLFKGAGEPGEREIVIPHVPRHSIFLDHMHLRVSERWRGSVRESERQRIEYETFAHGAMLPLLEGGFDIVHCTEMDVCNIVWRNRHLFRNPPRIVFSNGGAIPRKSLPNCDFVQEHTAYNLERSAREKAVMIPHGVDLTRFDPAVGTSFRDEQRIPRDALLIISVGTICYMHKRTDYVIREIAAVDGAYLALVGQDSEDSPKIRELADRLLGDRVRFLEVAHEDLPRAYAAADIFTLGSLFETFGIVYLEAMAMELPVIATDHPNQRAIIEKGVFIDMSRENSLASAVRELDAGRRAALGKQGRAVVEARYDLRKLKDQYIEFYGNVARFKVDFPPYSLRDRVRNNARSLARRLLG